MTLLALAGAAATAAPPRCAAVLSSTPFEDARLKSAAARLFERGGPAIRVSRDAAVNPGGYAVSVGRAGLDVAASDAEGAFRGLVELSGRCAGGTFSVGKSSGAPGFAWRGVLEGFYGKPWTWEERLRLADWMWRKRMNLLVIAPKDDPGLRADWRRPMTQEERSELARLTHFARERFVEVAWTLSPGLDVDLGSAADREAAAGKLSAAAASGVRQLVLAFDDTDPERGHVRLANRLLKDLGPKHAGVEWTFVGAEYWGEAAPSRYLDHVVKRLEPAFRLGWTGGKVLSPAIRAEEGARFREYARRPLVLGDNYPVQDRLWGAGRLFWGPLRGREAGLERSQLAYVANASPLAAASRLPLATAAEYAWSPSTYDPAAAWKRAIAEQSGGAALARFASYNGASWLEPAGGSAPDALGDLLEAFAAGRGREKALRELRALANLREQLHRGLRGDPELRRQLDPWIVKLDAMARASLAGLEHEARPGERALAARFERLASDAEALPGVVAGQALDRFLHRGLTKLYGGAPPDLRPLRWRIERFVAGDRGADLLLNAALDRLAGGPAELLRAPGRPSALWRDALPWVGLLGDAAARAREALGAMGGAKAKRGFLDERLARWRARGHFIGLAAAREMMEGFFAEAEGGKAKGLPWTLRLWLAVERRRSPTGLSARLAGALEARGRGDKAPLSELFRTLADLPAVIRQGMAGRLAEEGGPWLDKVGEYGRLGLIALEGKASGPEWQEARYRLRSANGLELVLELKLELDALARWAGLPPAERPTRPAVDWPADPRDML
ncbi:MAG: beta-N-acetylglucosaminidase domain-containing protein [Elusimicrobia bacterium]|nr:beta-N-acetylglucosaminidase domain-containing protein [Elusimicrobiota bacterium]